MKYTDTTGKSTQEFHDQLTIWNYQYSPETEVYFKYVGMGMMALDKNWNLSFIFKANDGTIQIFNAIENISELEFIPWGESQVFHRLAGVKTSLMLS